MKMIITIVIIAAWILYMMGFYISFDPFEIGLKHPVLGFGWVLLCIGLILILSETKRLAKIETYMEVVDKIEELKNDKNEQKS